MGELSEPNVADYADGTNAIFDLSEDDEKISPELLTALTTSGFACLTNTEVWGKTVSFASKAQEFFKQDPALKAPFERKKVADIAGYTGIGQECANPTNRPADLRELFTILEQMRHTEGALPDILVDAGFWDIWDAFAQLSHRVLGLLENALKLKRYFMQSAHHYDRGSNNHSAIRIAYYPEVKSDSAKPGQIRCGEHTDFGSLTLLYTDSPGLQVLNRQTGEYEDAGHVDGGIFLNIGDTLQMWSGDVLLANKHRVVNPTEDKLNKDRMSVIFFSQPDDDFLIETLDGSQKYPPVKSIDWLLKRLAEINPVSTTECAMKKIQLS